jgi:hypothetical protein
MKIPIIFFVSLVDEIQSSPSSLPLLCVRKIPQGTRSDTDLFDWRVN